MNSREYHQAARNIKSLRNIITERFKASNQISKKEFQKLVELLITVNGHAWCMDTKIERRKMAKLLINTLEEIPENKFRSIINR